MESILRLLSLMASAPMMPPPIARMAMEIIMPQSSNPIEEATRRHTRMFGAFIGVLIFTALLIALFTWLTEKSSNAVQDAIRQNADARINEAIGIAAEANARAAGLEREAAELRKDAEGERLARVKIEERLAWRRVPPMLYKGFVSELAPFAGSAIAINPLGSGDPETETFAGDIEKLLHDSHWHVQIATGNTAYPAPRGLICRVDTSSSAGKALVGVLNKLPGAVIVPTSLNGAVAAITVGLRPPP
jgi:hypothetical protein